MEREAKDALRKLVAVYRKATGSKLSAVSKKIYGHSSFLGDFFDGKRSVKLDNFDQIIASLSAIWPDGLIWPDTGEIRIARPPAKAKKSKRGKVSPGISTPPC